MKPHIKEFFDQYYDYIIENARQSCVDLNNATQLGYKTFEFVMPTGVVKFTISDLNEYKHLRNTKLYKALS